ncbi:MAG TPA: 1,4-alpha-glucan branching protein GlgB [Acidimicrobiales bacterium]|nr:1,4-alpha-glucan branching protein GlgB [Acidimicrobiales bacterium]
MTVTVADELARVTRGEHRDPHRVLGPHAEGNQVIVRVLRPDATGVDIVTADGTTAARAVQPDGLYEASLPGPQVPDYQLRITRRDGASFTVEDPYRFWPTIGELDLHLFGEGRHHALWQMLGARPMQHQGVTGTAFAVWAPNARSVRVVGDFNSWDDRVHPMRQLGSSGVWELFVPHAGSGDHYKYVVVDAWGQRRPKADPMATATELPPGTASRVYTSAYEWHDDDWMQQRRGWDRLHAPISTYEVHLGSWRRCPEEGDRSLTYREAADALADHALSLGFTHVELLPVAEHPFGGSWGYQVTSYYAPTSRFGEPDDFRAFVDTLHQRGLGVIVVWVPAHFPRVDWALANFDGTALYEHADPRRGAHPDWGTLVFNFGRHEVRNFLVANALYWCQEFHVDGLRVDAVASMLYLDYSRQEGEWLPNRHGGRENLEAIDFLREVNELVHGQHPGAMVIAEESTAWPSVSRPTYLGGLGFTFKWNMGWMHDTLTYFSKDPIHRRYHHNQLTFGLLYAFSENFVLPLSHDEVVHGKGSLLNKMPGDRWQQLANLRALYGWMWAHPGKKLLFMGGEIAQEREWSHDRSIDWHLLNLPEHAGVRALVGTLNEIFRREPALHQRDVDEAGFRWIDASDVDNNVLSFMRVGDDGARPVVCIANLSPVVHHDYRVGLPQEGVWVELVNTDDGCFGGSGVGNGSVTAEDSPWHGLPFSAGFTLPPLGVCWFAPA